MKTNLTLLILVAVMGSSCMKSSLEVTTAKGRDAFESQSLEEAPVETPTPDDSVVVHEPEQPDPTPPVEQPDPTPIPTPVEQPKPVPTPEPIPAPSIPVKIPWGKAVSTRLYTNLSDSKLASLYKVNIRQSDLRLIGCTNFNSFTVEQKKMFYIVLLAAIAERESDFDPRNETGHNIGLVQIDTDSAVRHASEIVDRDIRDEDLKNPHTNLYVGAFILRNQLTGKLIPGAKDKLFTVYYWEVLHEKYKQRVISSFKKFKNEVPFCQ